MSETINIWKKAFELLLTAKALTELYEHHKSVTSKYVHATSRGHEAIQIALGLQLRPEDYLSAYYRDDALLLSLGITPRELMLQLLAKRDDVFSGGRTYYAHPSLRRSDMPQIPHQSSATGMQAIPITGIALGLQYKEKQGLSNADHFPIAVCSMGDASCTEGEVAEAFQMAALKKLPILYLVQDNGWNISAKSDEIMAQDVGQYAQGFQGIEVFRVDGSDFVSSYQVLAEALAVVRKERRPALVLANVPLLNHHTSGVRKEWYRDDLEEAKARDPYLKMIALLRAHGLDEDGLKSMEDRIQKQVEQDFKEAMAAEDPRPADLYTHVFAPTPVLQEQGVRAPKGAEKVVMVDAALRAIREVMERHPEALLYGQDVGARLGGVFREAATLAKQFGDHRVFNTPIQEAFIVGSTVGMSAVGLKPIVEVQFADYIWPGLNQLFTEVSRSNYLSNGKWPVAMILRVPIGAYGSGGPYHSSSVESVLTNIKGLKIAYPSNGADLKGLMKAAFYDPNPVVMLEHKGLYWSKIPGTEAATSWEPDENYLLPFGLARVVKDAEKRNDASTVTIITYGMGVYWAMKASENWDQRVEIIDLRTLVPLDEESIRRSVKKHGRCVVLTEEPKQFSFAQSLAGWIGEQCFEHLDAPVRVLGAEDLPAIPLSANLEKEMLPNAEKLSALLAELLSY
ncbi:MAG TPA: thiamine pyrophosphate-dependent enzyme [Sphingobacteriaceae bacterium]|nr:thiamine pyrophosphate-dependent enzyme [Sphingobacteriaceae bacterium]